MALSPLVARALTLYRARLEDALPGRVVRVTLFGSYARGEAPEESDVDILVLLRSAAHAKIVDAFTGLSRPTS